MKDTVQKRYGTKKIRYKNTVQILVKIETLEKCEILRKFDEIWAKMEIFAIQNFNFSNANFGKHRNFGNENYGEIRTFGKKMKIWAKIQICFAF